MSEMLPPRILLIGRLTRDFIFYPGQAPRLDIPGGSALYAAAGAVIWEKSLALVSQVGKAYPAAWKTLLERHGLDVREVHQVEVPIEPRAVFCYDDALRPAFPLTRACLRAGIPFPQTLLGYQPEQDAALPSHPFPVFELNPSHHQAEAAYLCPMPLENLRQWIAYLYTRQVRRLVASFPRLEKSLAIPASWPLSLEGLEALIIHEKDLRTLFRDKTQDLLEMTSILGKIVPYIVVRLSTQRFLLYAAPPAQGWEIPAYVEPAFPIGIEEAFGGGFLAGLLRTSDALQAVLHGVISAAFKSESLDPFFNWDVFPELVRTRLEHLRFLVHPVSP